MPRHVKPRTPRRRLQGQRILQFVASYNTVCNGAVPVTAARKFVSANNIKAPAIIKVKRNSFTTDEFFYGEKGMFSLTYVEFNWLMFKSLKDLYYTLSDGDILADIDDKQWGLDEETYKQEYAFI